MSSQEEKAVQIRVPTEDPEKKKPEEEKKSHDGDDEKVKPKQKDVIPLDEEDIALIKSYVRKRQRRPACTGSRCGCILAHFVCLSLSCVPQGSGPYTGAIKSTEDDIARLTKEVNGLKGIKESDTGLSQPSMWDLVADKQLMGGEQPLQVARCTKIVNPGTEDAKYLINVKQIAKYVVGLAERVSPTDIEEGMRVGVDRSGKYQIHLPLPPKIDPSVTMMTVEEKPDVSYADVGGSKEQIEKIREVVELPMLNVRMRANTWHEEWVCVDARCSC